MNNLNCQITQLATTTVDVTRWCQQLERKLSQSLKDVEFFVVCNRTKGKDLSRFIDSYTARVNADTEWVNTWVDIWSKYVNEKMASIRLSERVTRSTRQEPLQRSRE